MNILYVGGFILPDRNAAAQRVVGVAKALRELDHKVFFLNAPKEATIEGWKEYFGFQCYEYKRENQLQYLTSISKIISVIKEKNISAVIAYNHPAVALNKLVAFCKKNNIKCYADVTEWYVAQGNPLFKLIKNFDSNMRMKRVHLKMDGIIAISRYLYSYYSGKLKTVEIPPLVDIQEEKWKSTSTSSHSTVKFVYAGSPDSQKERLDILVESINILAKEYCVHLDVVGITLEQYESIYGKKYMGDKVQFCGRVSHDVALEYVKNADWSIVIRDNNLVVKAGFPTKVAESISAGTPVIANRFSNIEDYLDESNSIIIEDVSRLPEAIENALMVNNKVDTEIFDYRNYVKELKILF